MGGTQDNLIEIETSEIAAIDLSTQGYVNNLNIGRYLNQGYNTCNLLAASTSSGKIYMIQGAKIYTVLDYTNKPVTSLSTGYFCKREKIQDLASSDSQGQVIVFSNLEISKKYQCNEGIMCVSFSDGGNVSSDTLLTGSLTGKLSSFDFEERLWRQSIIEKNNDISDKELNENIENEHSIRQILQTKLLKPNEEEIKFQMVINNTNKVHFFYEDKLTFSVKFPKRINWACNGYFGLSVDETFKDQTLFSSDEGDIYYLDKYYKPHIYLETKYHINKIFAYRPFGLDYESPSILVIIPYSQTLQLYYERQNIKSIYFDNRIIDAIGGNLNNYSTSINQDISNLSYKPSQGFQSNFNLKRKSEIDQSLSYHNYDYLGPHIAVALADGKVNIIYSKVKTEMD